MRQWFEPKHIIDAQGNFTYSPVLIKRVFISPASIRPHCSLHNRPDTYHTLKTDLADGMSIKVSTLCYERK